MSVSVRFITVAAGFAALALSAAALPAGAEDAPPAKDAAAPAAKIDLAHAEQTFEGLCTGCHDAGLATAQSHDRAGWEEVIDRMYGMGLVGSDEEVSEVLEYLVATYPAPH